MRAGSYVEVPTPSQLDLKVLGNKLDDLILHGVDEKALEHETATTQMIALLKKVLQKVRSAKNVFLHDQFEAEIIALFNGNLFSKVTNTITLDETDMSSLDMSAMKKANRVLIESKTANAYHGVKFIEIVKNNKHLEYFVIPYCIETVLADIINIIKFHNNFELVVQRKGYDVTQHIRIAKEPSTQASTLSVILSSIGESLEFQFFTTNRQYTNIRIEANGIGNLLEAQPFVLSQPNAATVEIVLAKGFKNVGFLQAKPIDAFAMMMQHLPVMTKMEWVELILQTLITDAQELRAGIFAYRRHMPKLIILRIQLTGRVMSGQELKQFAYDVSNLSSVDYKQQIISIPMQEIN